MRKRALRIRIVFGSKCECVSIAIHFAVGRIGLRVHVLREEQRAMPAYEEPPVLPGGSFLFLGARCSKIETISYMVRKRKPIKVNIFRRAVEGAGPYMRVLLVR